MNASRFNRQNHIETNIWICATFIQRKFASLFDNQSQALVLSVKYTDQQFSHYPVLASMMHLKSTRENKVKFIHDYVSHNTARNRVSIKNENQLDANILNFSVIFLWCSANPARSFSTRAQKRFSILNSASNGQIPHLDIIAKHDKYFKQDHDSGRGMLLDRSYSLPNCLFIRFAPK